MRLYAPAKVNWTMEVLGRRDDGYHEVRTVLQTVGLWDRLDIEAADALTLEVEGPYEVTEDDLVLRAARSFGEGGARIHLTKAIPVAAGLGGGSSDAAAALRGLNELWGLGRTQAELAETAGELGTDVAFFLTGGTALAEGRGERVTPLPDAPEAWLVLVTLAVRVEGKTPKMFGALQPSDFSDGSRSLALAERILTSEPVRDSDLCNAFERVAYERFERLEASREALLAAGASAAHLSGAGPALFALAADEAEAREMAGRVKAPRGEVFVAQTLSRERSLRLER